MWIPAGQFPWQQFPDYYSHWLQDPSSLTQRLRQLAEDNLSHQLIFEGWQNFSSDILELLPLSSSTTAWTREIVFYGHNHAWEWAKTIIPQTSLVDESAAFMQLGNKPIGDILFNDPDLKRSEFMIARLDRHHPYAQQANHFLNTRFELVWARRSLIYFYQKPLLIYELFLPPLFECIKKIEQNSPL